MRRKGVAGREMRTGLAVQTVRPELGCLRGDLIGTSGGDCLIDKLNALMSCFWFPGHQAWLVLVCEDFLVDPMNY